MRKSKMICMLLTFTLATTLMTGCVSQNKTQSKPSSEPETTQTTDGDTANETTKPEEVDIINSYDNTEELAGKFPVINETPIHTDLEKGIQNRLLTGFENWNRGYEAWEAWGDILYTPDSHYNVHSVHLTLPEYQMAMDMSLKATDMQMGDFQNMIICDDWTAVRYDITNTNRQTGETSDGTVMEFVNFKDYGEDLGVRVVEGWAGTKGSDFDALSALQTDEEKATQQVKIDKLLNAEIPDTDDLAEKYPILNPTSVDDEKGEKIKMAILSDFDKWNQGYEAWSEWADTYYLPEYENNIHDEVQTLSEYKASVMSEFANTKVSRVSFNNMLISGDWAAIYYNVIYEDEQGGAKKLGNVMQFLHFKTEGDNVRVLESWTK